MERSFFKKIYQLHRYAGLFVAVHVAIFSVTGVLLLFKAEIQGSPTDAPPPSPSKEEQAQRYQSIWNSFSQSFPQDRLLAFYPDDHDPRVLNTRSGLNGARELRGARKQTFDLVTGQEITAKPTKGNDFFDWLLRLHREMLVGSYGKLYVGFVGVVYLFMLISGLYIYGRFMRGRPIGAIRSATTARLTDWHKFIGAVTFGWGLVVALTGVLLAWNGVLIKIFQKQSLQHLTQQYQGSTHASNSAPPASFQDVIQSTLQGRPESVISYISFPDTEFGIPGHYLVLMHGSTPETERLNEIVVINAHSAALAEIVTLPWYIKAAILSEPLHFGDYGGLPLKLIWAAFTLGSLAVAVLGVSTFILRRNPSRARELRPASRNPQKPLSRWETSPLLIPWILCVLSFIGILAPLFYKHTWGQPAAVLLLVPLLWLILRRRSDA